MDESIQEEICQSHRGENTDAVIPKMNNKQVIGVNKESKPPVYSLNNGGNPKGIKLVSRESAITGGTLGLGFGAQSTRSQSIKT